MICLRFVVEPELRAHVALLTVAQDIAEWTWSQVDLTRQILRLRFRHRESFVEMLHKSGQEVISGSQVGDAVHAQRLHQAVLQRAIGAFHPTLGLAGVRT